MTKKEIYLWACDVDKSRGEGILANLFIKDLKKYTKKKLIIDSPKTDKKKINFSLYKNYITPFVGILKIWKNYLIGRDTCYVNFLPIWNFLIFFLLPPRTILGPITGSHYSGSRNDFNSLVRKYLLPILSYISIKILFYRSKFILFSTKNLESKIPIQMKQKSFFNFAATTIKIKNIKNNSKVYDIFFYYRKYSMHNPSFQKKLIGFLSNYNYKIVVAGDRCDVKNVIELGFVPRYKVRSFLKKTKISLNEEANFLSLFTIDSLESGCVVICNKKTINSNNLFNQKSVIPTNYLISRKNFLEIKKAIDCHQNVKKFFNFE